MDRGNFATEFFQTRRITPCRTRDVFNANKILFSIVTNSVEFVRWHIISSERSLEIIIVILLLKYYIH